MMNYTEYGDEWRSYKDVVSDYGTNTPPDADIVYASYRGDGYGGRALVVFRRDGKLFENNDSHCSCYGLEDWRPEETSVAALRMRKGWPGLSESLEGL